MHNVVAIVTTHNDIEHTQNLEPQYVKVVVNFVIFGHKLLYWKKNTHHTCWKNFIISKSDSFFLTKSENQLNNYYFFKWFNHFFGWQ